MATLYDGVIGMTVGEAESFLRYHHNTTKIRVVEEDGVSWCVTADYDTGRLNVVVAAGLIISIDGVG